MFGLQSATSAARTVLYPWRIWSPELHNAAVSTYQSLSSIRELPRMFGLT